MEYIAQLLKTRDIIKFADKWMRLEKKNIQSEVSQDPERKIYYVFTYMWILVVKSMITNL